MKAEKESLVGSNSLPGYGSNGDAGTGMGYKAAYKIVGDKEEKVGCWTRFFGRKKISLLGSHVPEDHCHAAREVGVNKKARRQLLVATTLCFCFMLTEAVGGYVSNSIAVLTDAAHLMTDLFAFIVSLSAIAVAARAPTRTMSFGWHRAEVLGAMVSVVLIWIITAILVDMAVDRLMEGEYEINAPVMVGTSVAGIIINIIMGCALNQDSVGKDESVNINVRAAFIHVLGDLIQSIGVCTAAIIIYIRPDWQVADPICTFIFSVIVFCTTLGVLKDAVKVLLECTPSELDLAEIHAVLAAVPGVVGVHNLRAWALSMDTNAVMVHLATRYAYEHQAVTERATAILRDRYKFHDICVQAEEYKVGMDQCSLCTENSDLSRSSVELTAA